MKSTRLALQVFAPLALLCSVAGADTVIVNQFGLIFDPPNVTINLGDTVRWVHNGGVHDVVEGDDGTIDGDEAFFGLLDAPNPIFEVTFDAALLAAFPRAGDIYDYFCSPHFNAGMIGTVTVLDQAGTSYCDCSGAGAPCNNPAGAGEGCANSGGWGAKLVGVGSTSALVDDLTFSGSQLVPGQAALLFVGTAEMNGGAGVPFGDGLRCAGGQIQRLGVRVPDGVGNATWGPGLNSPGLWAATDTRYFQIWYRDTVGGPCGSQFNVSNGYRVTFN